MNAIPPITVFPLRWIEPTSAKHIDRVLLDHLVVGHLIQSMPREHDAALREYSREELPRFDLTQGKIRIERHSKSLISDQDIRLLIRDQVGPNQPSNPHACLAGPLFATLPPASLHTIWRKAPAEDGRGQPPGWPHRAAHPSRLPQMVHVGLRGMK